MAISKLVVFILFSAIPWVLSLKKVPCSITDEECTTETVKHISKFIATGNPTYNIESSEPVHRDIINVCLPNLNFTLRNVYMHGLKDCDVLQLKFKPDESFYYYTLCPRLTIVGDYELSGILASEHLEGKGKCKIVQDDYHIGVAGQCETIINSEGVAHWNITKQDTDLLDVRGNVVYEFENLFNGDVEKSEQIHKYINKNWKKVNAVTEYPIMYSLMGKLFENVNNFLEAVPKDEIFYKYV